MAAPDDLDQRQIDQLLTQFNESGVKIAMVTDSRYRLRLRRKAGITWLIIEGMVMQPIPDEFTDRLRQLCEKREIGHAAIDLRACTYLCSGALGAIAQLLRTDRSQPGKVVLLGAGEKIRRLIELVGLGDHFLAVDDLQAAARHWLAQDKSMGRG